MNTIWKIHKQDIHTHVQAKHEEKVSMWPPCASLGEVNLVNMLEHNTCPVSYNTRLCIFRYNSTRSFCCLNLVILLEEFKGKKYAHLCLWGTCPCINKTSGVCFLICSLFIVLKSWENIKYKGGAIVHDKGTPI